VSHKAIRTLIEDTAKSLQDDIDYTYAKETDFNQARNKAFTCVNTSPLRAVPGYASNNGTTNYMKRWFVEMVFFKIDTEDSDPEVYAAILDEMDGLIDSFINKLNFFMNSSNTLLIQSISQDPAIKATSHILTGFTLSFQLLVNDNFDYCVNC
jgi:hypothetical protein